MSLTLRWVGEADYDRVAETRLRCYAPATKELERYKEVLRADPRLKPGDYLLAEDGDEAVGTASAMSFTTWVRGAPLPCQGIAWVGTVRTRRRRVGTAGERGIASQVMHECLREARNRGQVLSALMPFRASFYEHFGYGVVERRCEWTVPLAVLPQGPFDGFRFATAADRPGIAACHQRAVQRGQCDMERSAARWEHIASGVGDGFEVIDVGPDGGVRGYLYYNQFAKNDQDVLRVLRHFADDAEAFRRQLHFFASLRDQYHAVQITLPADVPLTWMLRERQLPHRLVNHPHATMRPFTRMQVRVLDHRRLLEAMRLPTDVRGEAVVEVRECEGHVSKFRLSVVDGRVGVAPTDAGAAVLCNDVTWAAVVLGELPVPQAATAGVLELRRESAAVALAAFGRGPLPFCEEYF